MANHFCWLVVLLISFWSGLRPFPSFDFSSIGAGSCCVSRFFEWVSVWVIGWFLSVVSAWVVGFWWVWIYREGSGFRQCFDRLVKKQPAGQTAKLDLFRPSLSPGASWRALSWQPVRAICWFVFFLGFAYEKTEDFPGGFKDIGA